MAAALAATKTGLLKKKVVKETSRELAKITKNSLLYTSLSAGNPHSLKCPYCMRPGKHSWIPSIMQGDEDAKQTLTKLVCSLAREYSSLVISIRAIFQPLYDTLAIYIPYRFSDYSESEL